MLTDPSYAGQIVTMTYPHIGNYGVNREDVESGAPPGGGLRRAGDLGRRVLVALLRKLHRYLDENGIVGISEIDTRALTRHLRTHGAKRGVDLDALRRRGGAGGAGAARRARWSGSTWPGR